MLSFAAVTNWLSLSDAAKHFGYPSALALRRRIHQLRQQGKVEDIGATPEKYLAGRAHGAVKIHWENTRKMQIDKNAPASLLAAKKPKKKTK
jgi:hypothetical protein